MPSCARLSGPTATLICGVLSATTAWAQAVLYADTDNDIHGDDFAAFFGTWDSP